MSSYFDHHLQQRKSSLSSLTRNRRQSTKMFESTKNQQPVLNKQSSNQNIRQQSNNIFKVTNQNTSQKQERTSSVKKNNSRLRDQESSDYIRNLYKKYLGKENKEPLDKLNAFTQRKLRTIESKELINTNTTAKDLTRRTLFPEQESQTPKPNKKQSQKLFQNQPSQITPLMKKDKNKISTVGPQQNQFCQNPIQKSNISHMEQSKGLFQSNKKESIKKKQKENYEKQCESKKNTNKNYKSKSKHQKLPTQEQTKSIILKRSQSTNLKWEKNPALQERNKEITKQKQRQRRLLQSASQMEIGRMKESQMNRLKESRSRGKSVIHPHRQSYCQFDTEQQIQNNNKHINHKEIQKINQKLPDNKQQICFQEKKPDNFNKEDELKLKGNIYSKYVNDLPTLELIVGKGNSLFQTLQKINAIKIRQKTGNLIKNSSQYHEQSSNNYQIGLKHRLIL